MGAAWWDTVGEDRTIVFLLHLSSLEPDKSLLRRTSGARSSLEDSITPAFLGFLGRQPCLSAGSPMEITFFRSTTRQMIPASADWRRVVPGPRLLEENTVTPLSSDSKVTIRFADAMDCLMRKST